MLETAVKLMVGQRTGKPCVKTLEFIKYAQSADKKVL